jgi:hypothetical protein
MTSILTETGVSTPTFNRKNQTQIIKPESNETNIKRTIARKKREVKMGRVVSILVGVGMLDKYQKLRSPNQKIGMFQKKTFDRRPVLIFAFLDPHKKNPSLKANYEDVTRVKFYRIVYFPSPKNQDVLQDATYFDIPVSSLERKKNTPPYNESNLKLQPANKHPYTNYLFTWDWTVFGKRFPARIQAIEKNGKESTRVMKNLALLNEFSLIPQSKNNQDISTIYDYLNGITILLNNIQPARNNMNNVNQVLQDYRNQIPTKWYDELIHNIQSKYNQTKERTALAYATYRTLVRGARKNQGQNNFEWQPTTRASNGQIGMLRSFLITKGVNNKGQIIYSNDNALWIVYLLFHFNKDDELKTILSEEFTTNTGKFLEISYLINKIQMNKSNEVQNVKVGYDELKKNPEHFEIFLKQFFGKNSLCSIVVNDEYAKQLSNIYRKQPSPQPTNSNSNSNSNILKNYQVV